MNLICLPILEQYGLLLSFLSRSKIVKYSKIANSIVPCIPAIQISAWLKPLLGGASNAP